MSLFSRTQFTAVVEWMNSQKSIATSLGVCSSTPMIQFHSVGIATAERSRGNLIYSMVTNGTGSGVRQLGLNPDSATYKLDGLGQVI